jgi:hypothetical protein
MYEIKEVLYGKYGVRCEVCGEYFDRRELTGHHIKMKKYSGKITEDNILIACKRCHFERINHIKYDTPQYWELMTKSLRHRYA